MIKRVQVEAGMASQIGPLVTVAELESMPDDGNRYELIEGELLVSRAPSLTHQRISRNLLILISQYLDQHPFGEVLATPGVIFDDFNSVIPDLIVVSNERRASIAAGERFSGAPEIIIEILSPGPENSKRDRVAKRQVYSRYGVMEYWVIDPESYTIEVYRMQAGTLELATTLTQTDSLASSVLPDFVVSVADIFNR